MDTSYCLKCKTKTNNVNPIYKKTVNDRPYVSSECAICGSKKSKFVSEKKFLN